MRRYRIFTSYLFIPRTFLYLDTLSQKFENSTIVLPQPKPIPMLQPPIITRSRFKLPFHHLFFNPAAILFLISVYFPKNRYPRKSTPRTRVGKTCQFPFTSSFSCSSQYLLIFFLITMMSHGYVLK